MITLVICIVSVIVLLILVFCYTVFVPHTLCIEVADNKTKVRFGVLKVVDTKNKKNKKTDKKSSYIKIPTPDTVNRFIKTLPEIYYSEKSEVKYVVKEVLNNCDFKRLDVSINFGTGDAALTAVCYGVFWQIFSVIYSNVIKTEKLRKNVNIAFKPYYEDFIFDFKIELTLKIILFRHLKLLLRGYKILKRSKAKLI